MFEVHVNFRDKEVSVRQNPCGTFDMERGLLMAVWWAEYYDFRIVGGGGTSQEKE